MEKIILTILLFFGPQITWATSVAAAGEHLLYFKHAELSSEHCERRGISTNQAHATWKSKNISLYRLANETLREEMVRRDLSRAEQDMVIAESESYRTKLVREQISKSSIDCTRFDTVLKMYSDLLKR